MPPAPKHAHALTISLPVDMTDDDFAGVINVIKRCKNTLYHHVISEQGENGKVHLHAGIIMRQDAPCTPSNFKYGTLLASKEIRNMLSKFDNTTYAIVNKSCDSNFWFAHYMDKEAHHIFSSNIPEDFATIQWAFTDIVTKKAANADYEKWARDYADEKRVLPATARSVEEFFNYHFFSLRDYRIPAARLKLKDRYWFFQQFINQDVNAFVQPPKKQKVEQQETDLYEDCAPVCSGCANPTTKYLLQKYWPRCSPECLERHQRDPDRY